MRLCPEVDLARLSPKMLIAGWKIAILLRGAQHKVRRLGKLPNTCQWHSPGETLNDGESASVGPWYGNQQFIVVTTSYGFDEGVKALPGEPKSGAWLQRERRSVDNRAGPSRTGDLSQSVCQSVTEVDSSSGYTVAP